VFLMLEPDHKPTNLSRNTDLPVGLQLLLFVDQRPTSKAHNRMIEAYFQSLRADYVFELQVIDIGEQPQLVEHFKLMATPALVKICPTPRQIIAGSDLIDQVKRLWPRWQESLVVAEDQSSEDVSFASCRSIGYSAELIKLSDEVFRLKQERDHLLEQVKFKDQVLAMLAHDLRSPLTAASIAFDTLELVEQQTEKHRKAIELKDQLHQQIKQQFRTMNRMITDLLQASKSKDARVTVHNQELDLKALVKDILGDFKERLELKNQSIETDLPQDLPSVYADPELIRQVIVNLLDNAVKYTPSGGKITVSLLHRTMQKVQVSIDDTGPGIPQEKQEQIFEGHFRLQRDQKEEGYGLGLSLCRKIIQSHYGNIWVDGSKNKGSCFHFTLPVYRRNNAV
jgi:two-component system, OmpR family, clock-associated histidine kinase SasA